jgi:thioredoxin reductase
VPGEDLDKVYYRLIDTATYRDRSLLVVGGGNSAVEAAVGLSAQPGNRVSLSYRNDAFFRLTDRNRRNLERAERNGRLEVLLRSRVTEIRPRSVHLALDPESGRRNRSREVANDFVFVFAGGDTPRPLLERAGVRFGVTPAGVRAAN